MSDTDKLREIFKSNLNRLLEAKGATQKALAEYMEVSTATVNEWKKGRKIPRMDKIDKLCAYFLVKRSDLLEPPAERHTTPSIHAGYKIPVLGNVAAGTPINAVEEILGYEYLDDKYKGDGYDYFALRIEGRSMEPTIMDGDTVIVRQQSDVENGDIAIVLVDGEDATAKEVKENADGITLIGHNASVYTPHHYSPQEVADLPIQIIGRVMEVRRKL